MAYGQEIISGGGGVPPVPFAIPSNVFRFGEQTIWSTQLFIANAPVANTQSRIFSTPLGQVGQGFTTALSVAETNLKEGGRVPAAIAYDVFGVSTMVTETTSTADAGTFSQSANTQGLVDQILNIVHNGVLSWDFTQTNVDICPVALAGAGGGLFGAVATTVNATSLGHMNNGNGSVWMYRKHPVALPGNSTFAILLRIGSRAASIGAANSVGVRVTLLGYYKNIIEIG